MRPSPLRHPLAVLRQIIGISQKELANLVGKSAATVQAIELGKLALSEELARKISLETGISMKWLLDGDPSGPPVGDFNNRPTFEKEPSFSKAVFERRRADRKAGQSGWAELIPCTGLAGAKLTAIQHAALNHPDRTIMDYRVWKFLEGLEKEFGISKKHFDTEMRKQELWLELEELFEDPDSEFGENTRLFHREFVPAFIKTYESLNRTRKKRSEKNNPQEPGIFPLLQWVLNAMPVISPAKPHKELLKKVAKAKAAKAAVSSKSPV
jgi:transcriptional regulator with XRE-family HTH domain